GFGYQVVQRTSDVLVSAPLEQYDTDKRGQIFRCSTERFKVNMSLGLSMTTDPSTKKTMVCGPTIPRDCKSITMYNGLCFEINPDNSLGQSYPSATEECRSEADIAFLLDGSGSVAHEDFNKMKAFVKNLIRAFLGKDTQFAITQFSSYPFTHYHFNNFPSQNWESEIDLITQQRGGTQTARAIREVDKRYKKNQNSSDRTTLLYTVKKYRCKRRLNLWSLSMRIASDPDEDYVFQVNSFEALDKIQENLQFIQMSMVGANQWRGGYKRYSLNNPESTYPFESTLDADSYLGYSMAIAKTQNGPLTIIGAPRYQHKGIVLTVSTQSIIIDRINPYQPQVGTAVTTYLQGLKKKIHLSLFLCLTSNQVTAESRVFLFSGLDNLKFSINLLHEMDPWCFTCFTSFCFVFRSRPVVMVRASVSFIPPQIPTQNPDCSKPLAGRATVCFTMSNLSKLKQAQAKINFTLTLDANREIPNNRAWISKNLREKDESLTLSLNRQTCQGVDFSIESCPEDALYPLNNALRFTFDGLTTGSEPLPSLSPQAQDTSFHSIGFEISCGPDSKCVDDLKVDFNFTKSSEVKVGIDELLNVTVFVENRGENSYNSHVILTYPIGLSFRKFETVEGRIECNSLDSEDGVTRGKTDCSINKPIFRSNSVAIFIVSYGHNPTSELDRKIYVTANATSGNNQSASTSVPYMKKEIDVKYSIYITTESSLSYNNFTYGENDLQKPLQQKLKVTNVIRALNFTIVIMVPVKLGDKEIWADTSSLKVDGCKKGEVVNPSVTDFIPQIKENKSLDCSVASCQVFRCSKFMEKNREETYTISGNISSRWIAQIGLLSAKFLLTSTANLEYDKSQFIFFSTTSNNDPPVHKIVAEVEVFQKPDFTKEIIGGSLGGLAFLLLLTAGLYKAGFFKSKYNQMINDNGEGDAGAGGDPPTEG
uniref:Integrin alpha-D-like n=1 Tax=Cyprinodon variegatus TaxID=28743 RepID=A0A3Q2DUR7_CYPVA